MKLEEIKRRGTALGRDRKHRFSLTMLFAGLVFLFLLVTMIIVVAAIFVLLRYGVLERGTEKISLYGIIAIGGAVSIAAGTILAATAGRWPMQPVNGVINAMNRLATGDFRTRLELTGFLAKYPVAKEFADSFNKMASELENTEMLRGDFVNNFSHEFKTPIVSIAGFAKLLKKGNLTPEERMEYLDIIESESLRLSAMATNVLSLTRVENQNILTDVTEFDLSEQIRNCVLLLERKWSAKSLEMTLDFDEYAVRGNEELLKLVWLNLLDNAVKFSPPGGHIDISVGAEDGGLCVSVSNTGSEIPRKSLEHIFRKFYQADESHATEGNGIGLAVVYKAVRLHGGFVGAESGGGRTVFTVVLPGGRRLEGGSEQPDGKGEL